MTFLKRVKTCRTIKGTYTKAYMTLFHQQQKTMKACFHLSLTLLAILAGFSTCSLLPSLLVCLPRTWLDKQQHMLQQIYSCTCADCPNIHVCFLARWLFSPETSKLLDHKASAFKEMLIRAITITRNSFI